MLHDDDDDESQIWDQISTIAKIPTWRPSLLWNQLNGDNSATVERIRAKFNTETDNQVLGLALPLKFRQNVIRNNKTVNIYVKKLPF